MKRKTLNILIFFSLLTYPIIANSGNNPIYQDTTCRPVILFHPVHISFTNIDYNEPQDKFEILFKLFIDDFDEILKTWYGKNLNLTGGRWENNYIETINQYMLEHFKLIINKKDKTKSSLKFVKKETAEDAIWLYYDFITKEKNNTFEVHNSLMTDLFMDQKNLLIFTYKGKQKALKFDYSYTFEVFSF
jgi:hypothetical protein